MSTLTVLSGPSAVGKGTVAKAVRRRYPRIWVSVSATTRAPRQGETDGVEYFFLDRPRFLAMVEADEFLEWAEFAGNLYGTPRAAVADRLAAGDPVLLEIDLQGARLVRRAMLEARLVFLAPPSPDELRRRLEMRGTETTGEQATRLAAAVGEIAAGAEFDAIIVNDDVERAADELVALMSKPLCCPGDHR